jgi:hypothetical protein
VVKTTQQAARRHPWKQRAQQIAPCASPTCQQHHIPLLLLKAPLVRPHKCIGRHAQVANRGTVRTHSQLTCHFKAGGWCQQQTSPKTTNNTQQTSNRQYLVVTLVVNAPQKAVTAAVQCSAMPSLVGTATAAVLVQAINKMVQHINGHMSSRLPCQNSQLNVPLHKCC